MAAVPVPENFDTGAVQQSVAQQKAAMLRALAQGGSALAQQYAAGQGAMNAGGAQAANAAISRSIESPQFAGLAAPGAAQAGAQWAYNAEVAGNQANAGRQLLSNIQQNNEAYHGQVQEGIGLVREQTQQGLNSMHAAATEAAAERALKMELSRAQLEGEKARLAAASKEDGLAGRKQALAEKALALEERKLEADLKGENLSPKEQLELRALEDDTKRRETEAKREAVLQGEGPAAAAAARAAMADADTLAEAYANLDQLYATGGAKTPKGKDLDKPYMRALLARLYSGDPSAAPAPAGIPPATWQRGANPGMTTTPGASGSFA